jgi:hypothetical protein
MDNRYRGMTLNERLYEAGLVDEWDKAVRARDSAAMTDLLVRVEIGLAGAEETVATVLTKPEYYGY